MPDTVTAPPPAAPPAPAIPTTPPPAPPASKTAIKPDQAPAPQSDVAPHVKVITAREKLTARIREAAAKGPDPQIAKEAGVDVTKLPKQETPTGNPPNQEAPPQAPKPAQEKPEAPEAPPPKPAEKTAPGPKGEAKEGTPDGEPSEADLIAAEAAGKKTGPWQLKQLWEKKAHALEAKVVDLETKLTKASDSEALLKRAETAEKRAEELASIVRDTNYARSDEFRIKYVEPFENTWKEAVAEITQLKVQDGEGNVRGGTEEDLLQLANLSTGDAFALAKERFGDLAPMVMDYRKAIRDLHKAQQTALQTATKESQNKFNQQLESAQKARREAHEAWTQINEERARTDPLLQPRDEDDEWNAKLESTREWIDKAYATPADNPKLSTAERREIVSQQAAIRNRAIAYTPLKLENARLQAELKDLKAELAKFQQGEPSGVDRKVEAPPEAAGTPMDRFKARIRGLPMRSKMGV